MPILIRTIRMDKSIFVILFLINAFSAAAVKKQTLVSVIDQEMVLSEAVELHLTSNDKPIQNGQVRLNHPEAWLVFDNLRPSEVLARYSASVFINDQVLSPGTNARVAIFRHGTAIMPHGTGFIPLEVYTGKEFSGERLTLSLHQYHNQLGFFDNAIRSFKLKRGYMATLANNTDGTGYSRVFIADEEDLEFSELPLELSGKVSFIRVFNYEWVSKKGWCGSGSGAKNDAEKTKSTWYYSWSADQVGTQNIEYVPIKQKPDWPGWTQINNKTEVSHLLGYNEPDRPDQANMSFDDALAQWPQYLKSGLRLGSPVTSDAYNSWGFFKFIDQCKALNYRVDFAVVHAYWAKSPQKWYDDLKYIHERTGLPLWITEWNNGANWTTEWWPTDWASQQQKQLNDLKAILNVLDTAHFVERYSIYNWVEDKRAVLLNGALTPAGSYYAQNNSGLAFRKVNEVVPVWKTIAAKTFIALQNGSVRISWDDPYNEFAKHYEIEKKINNGGYTKIFTSADNQTKHFDDGGGDLAGGTLTYRVKTIGFDNSSAYSNEVRLYRVDGGDTLQAGNFVVQDTQWQTSYFTSMVSEQLPIVLLGPVSYNNAQIPMTSRVKNIMNNQLQFHVETWNYLNNPAFTQKEEIALLLLQQGTLQLGKLKAESNIISGVTSEWKAVQFNQSFSEKPVVFSTQVTSNTNIPTTTRIRNVSKTGFEICLQKEEKNSASLFGDKVSFLAIEPGRGQVDGKRITVGIGPEQEVGGYYQFKEIEFDPTYTQPVFFAALQSVNDNITSTLRYKQGSANNKTRIFKQREISGSSDPVLKDQLGYMIVDIASSQPVSKNAPSIVPHLTAYPNPVHDILYFSGSEPKNIQISDITGRKQIEQTATHNLQVSTLPKGIYFLIIDGKAPIRLIKR